MQTFMSAAFEKYHGLGNDYLVLDPQHSALKLSPKQIKMICDRHFGIGSDGILYGPFFEESAIAVRIFNPDGSEAEKSGNGVRIFSKYLFDFGYVKNQTFTLATLGGDVDVHYLNDDASLMRVFMGKATFMSDQIPVAGLKREVVDEPMVFSGAEHRVTCLSIGNPHCVIPLSDISKQKAVELGQVVETAPQFPARINMQLLKVISRDCIEIEIFERGAGYTLASGSSSCAAACAAYRLQLVDGDVTVQMPGGQLKIEISPDYSIYMTGTVSRIGTFTAAEEFLNALEAL